MYVYLNIKKIMFYGNASKVVLSLQLLIITTFRKVYKTNKP